MKREKGNKTAMYALGVTPDLICATLSEERFCSFSSVYGLSGTLCKKILTTHRVQMDEDNVTPSRVVFLRCYFLRNVFFLNVLLEPCRHATVFLQEDNRFLCSGPAEQLLARSRKIKAADPFFPITLRLGVGSTFTVSLGKLWVFNRFVHVFFFTFLIPPLLLACCGTMPPFCKSGASTESFKGVKSHPCRHLGHPGTFRSKQKQNKNRVFSVGRNFCLLPAAFFRQYSFHHFQLFVITLLLFLFW